jgi:hypothetical protein
MPDILTRGVSDHTKKSIEILAATLGVSFNTMCKWILDEAAMPFDELRLALEERAKEVEDNKTLVVRPVVPSPKMRTQPMRRDKGRKA